MAQQQKTRQIKACIKRFATAHQMFDCAFPSEVERVADSLRWMIHIYLDHCHQTYANKQHELMVTWIFCIAAREKFSSHRWIRLFPPPHSRPTCNHRHCPQHLGFQVDGCLIIHRRLLASTQTMQWCARTDVFVLVAGDSQQEVSFHARAGVPAQGLL